jgi:uncharacterized membrane protein YkvA (DUF1232 family)
MKLSDIAKDLKQKLKYYRCLYKHPGTPKKAKVFLWLALGYAALPIDIIPDFIPVIGHLDDVIIIPLFIYLALKFIPEDIKSSCKS